MMTLTCQRKRTLIGTLQMFNSEEEMDLIIEILARVCGTTCANPDTTSPRHRRRDQSRDLQAIVVPGGFGRSTVQEPEQCRRDGFRRTVRVKREGRCQQEIEKTTKEQKKKVFGRWWLVVRWDDR
jgi:hypothetical protein